VKSNWWISHINLPCRSRSAFMLTIQSCMIFESWFKMQVFFWKASAAVVCQPWLRCCAIIIASQTHVFKLVAVRSKSSCPHRWGLSTRGCLHIPHSRSRVADSKRLFAISRLKPLATTVALHGNIWNVDALVALVSAEPTHIIQTSKEFKMTFQQMQVEGQKLRMLCSRARNVNGAVLMLGWDR
jgi:hypothetical protein